MMTAMNKAVGIIPARWSSTRFPGKPLHLIAGKALLQRHTASDGGCKNDEAEAEADQHFTEGEAGN